MDALWPGRHASRPRSPAAQGGALRAPGPRRRRRAPCCCATTRCCCFPDDDGHRRRRRVPPLGRGGRSRPAPSAEAEQALAAYGGPLLPDDPYEPWAAPTRDALAALHRGPAPAGRALGGPAPRETRPTRRPTSPWPAQYADSRRLSARPCASSSGWTRRCAASWAPCPSDAARLLRAELVRAGVERVGRVRRAARRPGWSVDATMDDYFRERMDRADSGRGSTVLLTGVPGVGKSALLDLAAALARRRGWRIARGGASAVEGSWPYAPVLEAFADLCRRHPALLDGLDDSYGDELDRALAGQEISWSGETAHQRLFVAAAELLRLAAAGHGLLLVVDDVHEADEASLRLLHYLARCAVTEPVVDRAGGAAAGQPALRGRCGDSLVARGIGDVQSSWRRWTRRATRRLLAHRFPDLDDGTATEIWAVSGGLPFRILEAARSVAATAPATSRVSGLATPTTCEIIRRVALLGSVFSTDELLAASGVDEAETLPQPGGRARDRGRGAGRVRLPVPARAGPRRAAGDVLARTSGPARAGRSPSGWPPSARRRPGSPTCSSPSGHPVQAIPYAAPGHRDRRRARRLPRRPRPARRGRRPRHRRGPGAPAGPARRPADRAGRPGGGRGATAPRCPSPPGPSTGWCGPGWPASRASRATSRPRPRRWPGSSSRATRRTGRCCWRRGNLAYFMGDIDAAWDAANEARSLLARRRPVADRRPGQPAGTDRPPARRVVRAVRPRAAAHAGRPRTGRRRLRRPPVRGRVPPLRPDPVRRGDRRSPTRLRRRAEHYGALRGVAFAMRADGRGARCSRATSTLAERELEEAVDLHHDVDASAGEAHGLQRLAEVRLASGDRDGRRTPPAAGAAAGPVVGRQLPPDPAHLRDDGRRGRGPGRRAGDRRAGRGDDGRERPLRVLRRDVRRARRHRVRRRRRPDARRAPTSTWPRSPADRAGPAAPGRPRWPRRGPTSPRR